jgi:uncharacterized protein YigA (DUF484 family)
MLYVDAVLDEADSDIAEFKKRIAELESHIAALIREGQATDESDQFLEQLRNELRVAEEHRQVIVRELRRII